MTETLNPFRDVPETPEDVVEELIRLTEPNYADGLGEVRDGADAEQVAAQVFDQDGSIPNDFDLSALWIFWGQFLDHDLDLTLEQEGAEAELLKDEFPFSVTRSDFHIDEDGVRQQENFITPFIDGSNVYGSDQERQDALRTGEGGKLKTGAVGFDGVAILPDGEDVFGEAGNATFTAGDIRATENPGLQSLHTLFVNEHNHWAEQLAKKNPEFTDEELFQNARVIVESLLQKITYEEFLPILLGDELPEYTGFKPELSGQITNEFSTAAFRFGHTSIPNEMTFLKEDGSNSVFEATIVDPFTRQPGTETVDGELGLLEVFDNQTPIENGGVAHVLRGMLEEKSQKIDSKVVDALNFFLFTPDGGLTGFSLPERNILRGRDHGIDSYINVRDALVGDIDATALIGSTDFSIITADLDVQEALAAVYGTVDQVDLWAGGIAEDYASDDVTIGITFQTILVEQFTRTRDADPLFYLNREFDKYVAEIIEETSLSDVIMRSGGVEHVQRDALLASNRIGGTEGDDTKTGTEGRDLLIGFGGDDYASGKEGDDDIFGGKGDDHLNGNKGDDGLFGGKGNDKMFGGFGDDEMSGGEDDDRLFGNSGEDDLDGDNGKDVLFGGSKDDDLDGGNGNDKAFGGDGDDMVEGGNGADIVDGGNGDDMLFGGKGDDTVRGGNGEDKLEGGNRNDLLLDGNGDDMVSGGNGMDTIRLGNGEDVIIFHEGETLFDKVFNFREEDQIELVGFEVGFDDLSLVSAGGGKQLKIDGDLVAEIRGTGAFTLDEADFIFS
ncbi:MAG: peroxidase family protein [Pseudomonadota bacterium]